MPPWLRYTLIRIVVFAIPLALLLFLGVFWLWAALVATVISACVSFIFLRRSRAAVAEQWATRRPYRTRDEVDEDAVLDAERADAEPGRDASAERERRAES